MTRLDAEKLETLRRWGEGLQHARGDELSAAGRAILLLVDEVERLYIDLWHARAAPTEPEQTAAPEPPDPLQETLRTRIRRSLGLRVSTFPEGYPQTVEQSAPPAGAAPPEPAQDSDEPPAYS
jgi:hypothetical protein